MTAVKYKVGDKVWLSLDSKWANSKSNEKNSANPTHCYGTIIDCHSDTYSIKWSNGENNGCYRDIDLLPHADTPTDSEPDLLEEAKRRYPVGTYFISPDDNNAVRKVELYTRGSKPNTTIKWYIDPSGKVRCKDGMGGPFCSNPHVYHEGKWAEIVSEPSSPDEPISTEKSEEEHRAEILAKFPPGTRFKPVYNDGSYSDEVYEVKADWKLVCGLNNGTFWFVHPNHSYSHAAYIRTNERDALIVRQEAVSSAENTDLRSARVKLLPEIEVRRKIII